MDIKISGIVIRGDGYGRKIGFPTTNLDVKGQELPESGVYSGEATLEGNIYRAGIIIGPKIESQIKVEAHLIGYNGDAYGKNVTLKINKFLREYRTFEIQEDLIIQIKKDLKICSQA